MDGVQGVENSIRDLGKLGEGIGEGYYHHEDNAGSSTRCREWGVVFQFIGYSSQHFPSTNRKMTIALFLAGGSGTAQ